MTFKSLIPVLLLINIVQNVYSADPIVQLPAGKIRGHVLKSEGGNDYYAFQEIPYAAPPLGKNRFQLPVPPTPWTDVLDTTKNTKICYQQITKYPNLNISEDCLYINVYTPLEPGTSDENLPVLVWIHGGGYTAESSTYEYYGPQYVMDQGIVVVTFNYRLGVFGSATAEDDVIPANLGMKDQRAALEWVHDNINLFNGDNSQVTVVGESAGSMAISLHLMGQWQENEKDLFQAAIMQSGSSLWNFYNGGAREASFRLGTLLDSNFSSDSSEDLLQLLQTSPAEDIFQQASAAGIITFPIIEKDGPFSYLGMENYPKGNYKRIPLLIGFNSEELIFIAAFANKEMQAQYDKNPDLLINGDFGISEENRTAAGQLMHQVYTQTTFENDLAAFIRFTSDSMFVNPALSQVEFESKFNDVYLYQFSYKGELGQSMNVPDVPGAGKVGHAEDLHFLWDDGSNTDLTKFPEEDQLMLHIYVKLWTNFIKFRNPTPEVDPFLQNVTWPAVDSNDLDNIKYLNINSTLEVLNNPRYYQGAKKVFYEYLYPPYVNN